MKYSYIALVLVAFYSLTSCVKNTLIQTEEELSVEAQKWKSFGFSDYDYTLEIICFCPIEYTKPKRISVRNNKVVSISNNTEDVFTDTSFMTIDGFFEFIEDQRKQNPVVEKIEYDPEYGFPTYIYFDISEMIADEEIGYILTNFVSY
jgi:hypothetical protein